MAMMHQPPGDANVAARSDPQAALEDGLGFRVGRLARAFRRGWALDLSPLNLSPPQAAVLRGVTGRPGCSLRALARTLGADPMSVKHCVDELEGRGLIRSGCDPGDRRRRTLTATPAGQSLARKVNELARQQQSWLESTLSPSRWKALEASLSGLERALGIADGQDR